MKYYKVKLGYNEDDYISVSETELPKAITLFLEGTGRGLFDDGAIRGQDIMRIRPDWHKLRGWNRSWKMQDSDYADIQHLESPYRDVYQLAEEIAKQAMQQNHRELLSQNKPLEDLESILIGTSSAKDNKKLNEGL